MTRRLLNLLTALSLLLCVAAVAVWVRSHWRMDEVRFAAAGGRLWRVLSSHGRLQLLTWDDWPAAERLRWRCAEPQLFPDLPPITSLPGDPPLVISAGNERGSGAHRTFYRPDGMPPPVGHWGAIVDSDAVQITPRTAYRHDTAEHRTFVLWLLAMPAAWLTDRALRATLRRRRRNSGLCPSCGYDLRATPGRCPECGTEPMPANVESPRRHGLRRRPEA